MSLLDMTITMVKDNSGRLDNDDYVAAVSAAIAEYSRHKPQEIVVDVLGNGSHDLDEPAGWVPEFSVLRQLEYPAGLVPGSFIEKDQLILYNTPAGEKIRLLSATPTNLETVRITFTIPRTEATIVPTDLDAVSHLSAAHALRMLANRFIDTTDPLIAADVVNYQQKSDQASRRAKDLEKLYRDHLGIKEDDPMPAASATMDMAENYPGGSDRLTHAHWARQKR